MHRGLTAAGGPGAQDPVLAIAPTHREGDDEPFIRVDPPEQRVRNRDIVEVYAVPNRSFPVRPKVPSGGMNRRQVPSAHGVRCQREGVPGDASVFLVNDEGAISADGGAVRSREEFNEAICPKRQG